MIVEARRKRDKHFDLLKKLKERIRLKNVVISDMNNGLLMGANSSPVNKSKDLSKSMLSLSPAFYNSVGKSGETSNKESSNSPISNSKRRKHNSLSRSAS